jgi:hypothetical protein
MNFITRISWLVGSVIIEKIPVFWVEPGEGLFFLAPLPVIEALEKRNGKSVQKGKARERALS